VQYERASRPTVIRDRQDSIEAGVRTCPPGAAVVNTRVGSVPLWLTLLAGVVLLELASDFSATTYAQSGRSLWSGVAVLFAICANLTFQAALRNGAGLARGGTLFGVSVALGAVLLGIFVFGERLSTVQVVGMPSVSVRSFA
jgi:multidrug transporter EmrE-like cation transporter